MLPTIIGTMGVLVVASAGNENGPVDAPGNCPGVLAVAGLRNVGTKVGYSSFGSQVGISAPAGNCVNSTGDCLRSIDTTSNTGLTTPGTNTYTNRIELESRHQLFRAHRVGNRRADALGERESDAGAIDCAHRIKRRPRFRPTAAIFRCVRRSTQLRNNAPAPRPANAAPA